MAIRCALMKLCFKSSLNKRWSQTATNQKETKKESKKEIKEQRKKKERKSYYLQEEECYTFQK